MAVRRRLGRPTSIRARLTALATLVTAAGLLVSGLVILALVRHDLMTNAHRQAEEAVRATAGMLADSGRPPVIPAAGDDRAVVQVVDAAGNVVVASANLDGRPPLVPRWPVNGASTETLRSPTFGDGADYLVVGLATTHAGRPVAVYAASSLEPVTEGIQATALALAAAIPLLLAVVAGTSWRLVGAALRPVDVIRGQVSEITANQLDRRVPEPAVDDELARLAHTMNAMLERLQRAQERQRQFTSDASHELRSPLATIRTSLEIGLAHPDDTEWLALARAVHRECDRLDRLTDELLMLSRLESATEPAGGQQVDLDELVLSEVEAIRIRGRVTVDLSPFSAVRMAGRTDELRRVVRNLLDNAERHAVRRVVIGLSADHVAAKLVISDDGDGIPSNEREKVFERFYRLQDARDRDSGGAGLGLAIVRAIVTGHGGRVWVGHVAHGAELHVRLPLRQHEREHVATDALVPDSLSD